MSEPNFKAIGNKYIFRWEEEKLEAEVARLHLHQDGRLTCNLTFRTSHPQYEPHLLKTSFNLSSSRSRADFKKQIVTRYREKVNWDAILEVLCLTTEAKFEEGEPIQKLWIDDSEIEAPGFLLDPILLKGVPTLIFGEKGTHKTTLALFLMACLTLPWRDNPLGLGVPDHPIIPLLLDWEQEEHIVRSYAKRIKYAAGLATFPLLYRHCALPLTRDFDKIQSYIDKHSVEVIIIDSVGAACGGKLKDPDPVLEFFAAIRALKVTTLLLGQQSKDPEAKYATPFGSTYFRYYSRAIYELKKSTDSIDDEAVLALLHREGNYTKRQPPLGFSMNYNGTGISVQPQVIDLSEFIEKVKAQQLILDALKQGALTLTEIADITGVSDGTARVVLTRLKKRNKVMNPERGRWGLPYND